MSQQIVKWRRGRYVFYYCKKEQNRILILVQVYWALSLIAFTRQTNRIEPNVDGCRFKIMSFSPYADFFFSKLFGAKQSWKKNETQISSIRCIQSEWKRKLLKEFNTTNGHEQRV